ncbi:hypothetical protein RCIA107 [Methanocella arvoryzae MRE50]|uniref:Uncharacterized protein n=1 Tax=Methanocella arvoryzae (strain DSM 22066 / NBRC 105507 / MRE50) TaxID=351160 RepID=Q0W4J6_METAR|nr:hypothetical protein RCIA107 [Methanocella arvoryzae MRE50]
MVGLLRFFGCYAVRAGLAPSQRKPGRRYAAAGLRCFASPKHRRLRQAVIALPPPHPADAGQARKTFVDREY